MFSTYLLIPVELWLIIREYANAIDYRHFLSTTKRLVTVKKQTLYLSLSSRTTNYYLLNEDIKEKIEQMVENPRRQIALIIDDPSVFRTISRFRTLVPCHKAILELPSGIPMLNLSQVVILNISKIPWTDLSVLNPLEIGLQEITISIAPNLVDISKLNGLRRVSLYYCPNLTDISSLRHVNNVELNRCDGLSDICVLGDQDTVTLIDCYGIEDISSLATVRCSVTIQKLPKVRDISALGHVPRLEVRQCPLVNNMQGLQQNQKLIIDECAKELTGFEVFKNSKTLRYFNLTNCVQPEFKFSSHLHSIELTDCHLYSVKELAGVQQIILTNCAYVSDLSPLANVPSITLNHMLHVSSLRGLGNGGNQSITLFECFHIYDFYPLKNVPRVTIKDCFQISNGNDVANVRFLTIQNTSRLVDVHMLDRLEEMTLIKCSSITTLNGLKYVKKVWVEDCESLVDIMGLGKNQQVVLVRCNLLENDQLVALIDVPDVTIKQCAKISSQKN